VVVGEGGWWWKGGGEGAHEELEGVSGKLASSGLFGGCVFVDRAESRLEDMSLENLIKMQSSGARSIEEPNTPRPGGVPQGTVLVILDVTKEVATAAVYWALGNVVRRGDNFKVLGLVTHMNNPSKPTTIPPQCHHHTCQLSKTYLILTRMLFFGGLSGV
jgi:hypothetical protein